MILSFVILGSAFIAMLSGPIAVVLLRLANYRKPFALLVPLQNILLALSGILLANTATALSSSLFRFTDPGLETVFAALAFVCSLWIGRSLARICGILCGEQTGSWLTAITTLLAAVASVAAILLVIRVNGNARISLDLQAGYTTATVFCAVTILIDAAAVLISYRQILPPIRKAVMGYTALLAAVGILSALNDLLMPFREIAHGSVPLSPWVFLTFNLLLIRWCLISLREVSSHDPKSQDALSRDPGSQGSPAASHSPDDLPEETESVFAVPEKRLAALAATGGLTVREAEILRLLVTGHSNIAIGERLFISPHTVKNHTHNIYRKLEAGSRGDLLKRLYPAE